MRTHSVLWIVPAALSLLALAPLPYGFYMLLRVTVCASCAYLSMAEFRAGGTGWGFGLGLIALIFNPLIPIHLGREVWSVLNVLTAGGLLIHFFVRRQALSNS